MASVASGSNLRKECLLKSVGLTLSALQANRPRTPIATPDTDVAADLDGREVEPTDLVDRMEMRLEPVSRDRRPEVPIACRSVRD